MALGGPINWLAGAERYSYRTFLFWDISGQLLGALIPLGIGYTFAASWGEAESLFGSVSWFALAFLATLILSLTLVRRIGARKTYPGHDYNERSLPGENADCLQRQQRVVGAGA